MFHPKKWRSIFILLVIGAALPSYSYAGVFSPEPPRDSLIISGTPLITPMVKVIAEAFKKYHPTVDIFVEDSKDNIAFDILKRGNIDIALTSVVLSPEQDTLLARGQLFARGAIVAVVNDANKVDSLTPKNVHDIFVGKIRNWREIGGDFNPIKLIIPVDGSIDLDLYKQIIGASDEHPSESAIFNKSAKERLEQVTRDATKITFVRRREFNSLKMGKLVKINGFGPTDQAILSQFYPLYVGYYLNLWGHENLIAQEFVDFTLSEEGQKIVAEQGQIAVQ